MAAPALFTILTGVGVTNLATTATHSLSITPSLLQALVQIHQPLVTCTAPSIVATISTNIITVAVGVGTLTTVDVLVGESSMPRGGVIRRVNPVNSVNPADTHRGMPSEATRRPMCRVERVTTRSVTRPSNKRIHERRAPDCEALAKAA